MSESSTPSSNSPPDRLAVESNQGRRLSLVERSLHSLDWPGVIEALAERASTRMGEELCWGLPLLESPEEAEEALAEASRFRRSGRSSAGAFEWRPGSGARLIAQSTVATTLSG